MKTVPLQHLKQHLSALVSAAEAGEQVLVTRHGRPVVLLTSAVEQHLTLGSGFGKGSLNPLFKQPATRGRYLTVLEEDRGDGEVR